MKTTNLCSGPWRVLVEGRRARWPFFLKGHDDFMRGLEQNPLPSWDETERFEYARGHDSASALAERFRKGLL